MLIIIFCSALFSAEYIGVILCVCVSFWIAMNDLKRKSGDAIFCGFLLLVMQNLMIGLGARLGNNTSSNLRFLAQIPSLYIYCVGSYAFLRKRDKTVVDVIGVMLIAYLSLSFFLSSASFSSKLPYLRNCSLVYFIYLVGKYYVTPEKRVRLLQSIINTSVLLAVIGALMMLLPVSGWEAIGIREVYIAKNTTSSTFLSTGLPIRFYTTIGNYRFYRMASIMYEPVNFSYILSFALIMLLFDKTLKKRFIKGCILLAGELLTFGKGGFLMFSIACLFVLCNRILSRFCSFLSRNMKKKLIIIGISIAVAFAGVFYFQNIGGSATAHFTSIIRTMESIGSTPLGRGLGYGGNYGQAAYGSESGIMAILAQLGIPFTILFAMLFLNMAKKIEFENLQEMAIASFPVGIVIAAIFQENTLGPQCCYLFMCTSGIYAQCRCYLKKETERAPLRMFP